MAGANLCKKCPRDVQVNAFCSPEHTASRLTISDVIKWRVGACIGRAEGLCVTMFQLVRRGTRGNAFQVSKNNVLVYWNPVYCLCNQSIILK